MKIKLILFALILTANVFAQSIPTYVIKSKVKLTYNYPGKINQIASDTLIGIVDNIQCIGFQTFIYNYRWVKSDFSMVVQSGNFIVTQPLRDSMYNALKAYIPTLGTSITKFDSDCVYWGFKAQGAQTFSTSIANFDIIAH